MSTSPDLKAYLLYAAHRMAAAYRNLSAELPPLLQLIFVRVPKGAAPSADDVFMAHGTYPLHVIDQLDDVINADLDRLIPLPKGEAVCRWHILELDHENQLHVEVCAIRKTSAETNTSVQHENRLYHFANTPMRTLWPSLTAVALLALLAMPVIKLQWVLHHKRVDLDHQLAILDPASATWSSEARLKALQSAALELNAAPSALLVLNQISDAMPKGAWLISLSVENDDEALWADMVGFAPSAAQVLSSLSGHQNIAALSPQGATRIEGNNERFHLRARLLMEQSQ